MPYEKTNWEPWPSVATAITADRLNNMENVISQADTNAAAAAASAALSASLVSAPADSVASALVGNASTLTGRAVLDAFRDYLGSSVRDSEPLTKWKTALATAGSARVQAVAIGDSITQGGTASSMTLRWQNLLQEALRNGAIGATHPFLPGYMANAAWGIGRAGNVTSNTGFGLSWYTAVLNDATSSVTFLFTGDRFELVYSRAAANGLMSVTIDGGAPTVVSTSGASGTVLWASPVLADAAHTVVVTRDASSSAGALIYLQGALTYRGDYAAGVRILDAGHSAFASSDMVVSGRAANMAGSVQAAGGAKLAIIAFGTNDYSNGTSAATFKTNIEATIAALRAKAFDGSVLLLGMYMGQGRTPALWQAYLDALAAIADADADVAFLDLRDYMPDVPTPFDDAAGKGYFADALHPSDAGHARIAAVLGPRTKGANVIDMLALRA